MPRLPEACPVEASAPYFHQFTVFTPTFNRARTLPRVHESLQKQTFRDFEWLIVDDGSTDGTAELVARWQRHTSFPIRYVWQRNQGKHVAFNLAVGQARGELFLTLDSDDACVPEALERLAYHWQSIPADQRATFSAVSALCVDHSGRVVGSRFPRDVTDSDSLEIRYRYKVTGEKWGFHRTDVLKRFPFPVVHGVRFIPESVVWTAIAGEYRTRYVNEPLRVYWAGDAESDQLTRAPIAKVAAGRRLYYRSVLNHHTRYFRHAPTRFLRSAALYARCSFHVRQGLRAQAGELTCLLARTLWATMLPVGFLLYMRDAT